jgi:hypothetical protein
MNMFCSPYSPSASQRPGRQESVISVVEYTDIPWRVRSCNSLGRQPLEKRVLILFRRTP